MRTQPKWIAIAFVAILVTAGCGFASSGVLRDVATGHLSAAAAALPGFMALVNLYLVWVPMRDCMTTFSSDGVTRLGMRGRRLYSWSELTEIRSQGNLVDFIFAGGRFRVNLYLFKNAADIVEFVRARVSPTLIRPIRHDWIRESGQGWKLWVFYVAALVAILSLALVLRAVESAQGSLVFMAITFGAATVAALLWLPIAICCPWCGYRVVLHVMRCTDARNWLFAVHALEECPRCVGRLTRAAPSGPSG